MAEFLNMNGYGFYIWSAYGAALTIFIALALATLYKSFRLKREQRLLGKD